MVYRFFDKKSALHDKSKGSDIIDERIYQLAKELHKLIINKLKKKFIHHLEITFGVLI